MQLIKVKIRELSPKFISKNYINWMNDKKILKYLESGRSNIKEEDLKKYVLAKKNSSNDYLFGIFVEKNHIGNIKLSLKNKKNTAQLGYIIGVKKYQNKGLASKAINKILMYGFKKKKLKKIMANSEEKNFASIRVLEKNGFRRTCSRLVKRKFEKKKLVYYIIEKKNWLKNYN